MEVDHLFIFSASNGNEADELRDFGFTEGSSRVHPGQGTCNRKFYFENFFLEILWVMDELELQSDLLAPTKLSERAKFRTSHYSPFGLCLLNDASTNALFARSLAYQPAYFPPGAIIEVITNEEQPSLPWTFRLPFKGPRKQPEEPMTHQNGLQRLTSMAFGVPRLGTNSPYIGYFKDEQNIVFIENERQALTLTFDNHRRCESKIFDRLPLTINY